MLVNDFETEPMRKRVTGVTGTRCSKSENPKPSSHTLTPPTDTAMEAPGEPFAANESRTICLALAIAVAKGVGASACDCAASGATAVAAMLMAQYTTSTRIGRRNVEACIGVIGV
jgi:hypothetical protein